MTPENLFDFQRKRALEHRVINSVKRNTWRQFCSTIGRGTESSGISGLEGDSGSSGLEGDSGSSGLEGDSASYGLEGG